MDKIRFFYLRNRYYDPKLGRFTSEDAYWNPGNMIYGDNGTPGFPDFAAIMQSSNLYAYCMNNPVNFIDPWGGVAGEKFRTVHALTQDWAWNYYPTSDYIMMEQASAVYKGYDENGVYYSYTEAVVGYPHYVDMDLAEAMVPYGDGVEYEGAIHSHPQGGDLSENDRRYADSKDAFIIAVYYETDRNQVIARSYSAGGAPTTIAQNIPMPDPWLSDERKEYLKSLNEYANRWYTHETPNCTKEDSTCQPWLDWKPYR